MTRFEREVTGKNLTESVAGVFWNRCPEGGILGQHDWDYKFEKSSSGLFLNRVKFCSRCPASTVREKLIEP